MPASPSPTQRLPRQLLRLGLFALIALAVVVGAATVYDEMSQPNMDFEPEMEASALDLLGVPWADEKPGSSSEGPALEGGAPEEAPGGGAPDQEALESPEEGATGGCHGALELPSKWITIGWDGADWQFVLPLLAEGRLPNLEALMRGGTYGTLASIVPTLSPAIWTTVATGTTPEEHGIMHFYYRQSLPIRWWQRLRHFGELKRRLFTNADRRRHAIWNLAHENERRVMTVGYHNTFPVEPVNGLMVSNYLVQDSVAQAMKMDSGTGENDLASSLVYPIEHLTEVLDVQKEVQSETRYIAQRFAGIPDPELTEFYRDARQIDPDGDQKPYFLVHAWLFDEIVARVTERFLTRIDADLTMTHFQGVDWASHRFLFHHAPELFDDMEWSEATRAKMAAEHDRYRRTVSEFYVYLDQWLGRFMEQRTDDTGVLLLSDHGFAAEADTQITGGHDHAPPGIFVINGKGIRRDHKLDGVTVYDIMPTLMAGLGLPVADDLRGRVMDEAFCPGAQDPSSRETVPTYSSGRPYVPEISRPEALDDELLQQMKSLGYIQ